MADVKRFKNGNLNIRFTNEEIEDIISGHVSEMEILVWSLEDEDTYPIGEEFCLSNYAMGCRLYSYYADKVYILNFQDFGNVLLKGKTLKLIGYEPLPEDRDEIKNL